MNFCKQVGSIAKFIWKLMTANCFKIAANIHSSIPKAFLLHCKYIKLAMSKFRYLLLEMIEHLYNSVLADTSVKLVYLHLHITICTLWMVILKNSITEFLSG